MRDRFHRFLCSCLRSDGNEARHLALDDPRWHWEGLFEQANNESVLPVINLGIRQSGIETLIPPEVRDFVSSVEFLNRERNAAIFADLKKVAALLNEAGIEPVLLKGAAYIATGVYGDASERYMEDLDLLIPEAQLRTAAEILMRNGYIPDQGDQFAQFRHHEPALSRLGSVPIELHHALGLGKCSVLLPAQEVIERSLAYDLDGLKVRVPCPEDLMTHLIMHSQVQHPYNERIWPPLRAMYDLMKLVERFGEALDWSGIEQQFRAAGQKGVLKLHLLQVRDSLGVELPLAVHLTPLIRLRWLRRRFLRALPAFRYVDPIYMVSTLCIRRVRVLRNVLSSSGGWKYLVGQLLRFPVYQSLLSDVVEGRGH